MKLIPEVQKIIAPPEWCLCDGKGVVHRTYFKEDILSGEVDFERDEPCENCAERERLALAIQKAVAEKCVEIAADEFLHYKPDNPEDVAYNSAVGRVVGAIRTHFELGGE